MFILYPRAFTDESFLGTLTLLYCVLLFIRSVLILE
jgi:hypothetical protein